MAIFTKSQWKKYKKLWNKRQRRFQFYEALSAFQLRNNLNSQYIISKRKQSAYKKRMNKMYKQKIGRLFKRLVSFKKKYMALKKETFKFQLKFGIYDE